MKRANRTELIISKHIRGLSCDNFRVIVSTEEAESVKKEYEKRGYTVCTGVSYSYYKNFSY